MIRNMIEEDIYEVIDLEKEVFKETLGFNFLYNELNLNPFQKYFVYEINSKIKGYIGLRIYEDTSEVINFLVKPICQSKKIGTKLIKYVLNYLKENNVKSITLEVDEKNIKAINFYNKFNFYKIGVRKNYYKNKNSAYILKKDV